MNKMRWDTSNSLSLKFRLGEFILWDRKFRGLLCETNFLEIPVVRDFETLVESVKRKNEIVAYCPSIPVQNSPGKITFLNGFIIYATWVYQHQYVNLNATFEAYEKGFSSKTRSTLRRKVRKFLNTENKGEFKVFQTPAEMDAFFADAQEISKTTYQERMWGQGIPASENYLDQLKQKASHGEVTGFILYSDGQPVAYTIGDKVGDGIVLYGLTGYNPEFSRISPGTVLQYLIIKHLFEQSDNTAYDLCTGEAAHKLLFGNDSMLCADVYVFGLTPYHVLLVFSHFALETASSLLTSLLDKLGVKAAIKKFIRRVF